MTPAFTVFALCTVGFTLTGGLLYRRLWLRSRGPELTPTGFGVLLALVLFGAAIVSDSSLELRTALGVTAVAAAAYWLDDVHELSARVRILISFASGIAIAAVYFAPNDSYPSAAVIGICLVAGVLSVVLTNIVNFYDGADLNLATFIALTAGLILFFSPADREWAPVALAGLAFVAPFALMNSQPRTLYLGDSGSFAFASLLTIMAAAFIDNFGNLPPEAAIPAALPAFDTFFVFAIRVREKHDLLTRNYLHLYQRLDRRYAGFGYLVPQIANAALCLMFAAALQLAGLGRILSVILAMIVVTIPFYFACRAIFLDKQTEDVPRHGSEA